MIYRLLCLVVALAALLPARAATDNVAKAFADAPRSVFPLLDHNTRLDMIDYFNAGQKTESANVLEGGSRITALDDATVTIKMTDASTVTLALLPAGGNDVTYAVITTVATPGKDSAIAFYDSSWQPIAAGKCFTEPTLRDWLTDAKRQGDVEMVVPFMLASYDYVPATLTLQAVNNLEDFLSPEVYSIVAPYMQPVITYKWNGKRFTRQ